jgi:tetratricopeptide (TPR) repeat protein
MAMALSALAVLPYAEFSRRRKFMAIAAGILMAFGLFVLNYPTIWVGLALLMIMISSARFVAEESLGAPIVIAIAAVCMALLGSYIPRVGSIPQEVVPNFSASWSVATQAASGKRIFAGTGPATFGLDYSLYRPASLNQTNFWGVRFNQGYNMFTTLYANQGLLGIIAILSLIIVFLKKIVSGLYDKRTAPLVAALLMSVISWFFFPSFLTGHAYLFIGFGLLATFVAPVRTVAMRELRPTGAFVVFMVFLGVVAVAISSGYFLAQKYYAAYAYAQGSVAFAMGDADRAATYFRSAVRWDAESDQYLRGLSQGLLASARAKIQTGGENNRVIIQQELALAVQSALRAVDQNPKEVLNYTNTGNVYENLLSIAPGAEQAAYTSYKSAGELEPASPLHAYTAARVYVVAATNAKGINDTDGWRSRLHEAKQLLEKSLALKPDYAEAHFLLAQIYLQEGDFQSAVSRVEAIKAANPYDAGIAFQLGLLYYNSGKNDLAGVEFERAIAVSPDYANAKYFLGLVYDKQGKKEEALAQFRRIQELNPTNEEVRRIVMNLESGKSALQDIAPPSEPPEKRDSVPVPDEKKKE